jgi:sugar/nucleoside kinase (ribokinase family)
VPSGDRSGLGRLEPVLPHVDVFLPNEDEGRALLTCPRNSANRQGTADTQSPTRPR